jgi:hypothetical protein
MERNATPQAKREDEERVAPGNTIGVWKKAEVWVQDGRHHDRSRRWRPSPRFGSFPSSRLVPRLVGGGGGRAGSAAAAAGEQGGPGAGTTNMAAMCCEEATESVAAARREH